VSAFRGQWTVEELFRRAKIERGRAVGTLASMDGWGATPAHLRHCSRTDARKSGETGVQSRRVGPSNHGIPEYRRDVRAILVRIAAGKAGRRPTVMLAPELTAQQRRAVKVFDLERWFPTILSCMKSEAVDPWKPCENIVFGLECESRPSDSHTETL